MNSLPLYPAQFYKGRRRRRLEGRGRRAEKPLGSPGPGLGLGLELEFRRERGLSRVGVLRIRRGLASVSSVVWRGSDLTGATEIVEN